MFTRAGFGQYRANEWHVESLPHAYRPGRRLVIWCHEHGAGGLTFNAVRDYQGQSALAEYGLPAASADLGGPSHWGNDAAVAAIDDLWLLMRNKWAVAADKVLLLAGSMGNLVAFNYLRANPGKVAAVASLLPAVDLAYFHDVNPEANADPAEIEAAYGGLAAYQAALPTHSPAVHKASGAPAKSVPIRIWSSTNDPLIPNATAAQFAADVGASTASLGAVGHSFGTELDRRDLARWLAQYA